MAWVLPNKSALKGWLARLAILTFLLTGLQLSDISGLSPAIAADPVTGLCRSSNGDGLVKEPSANLNGYYTSLASRDSDSITGLKITPVFSKRMYIDASKNFDATYIAYQIENTTTTAYPKAKVTIDYIGTFVKPVSDEDKVATIDIPAQVTTGTGGSAVTTTGKATVYFMVRATGPTDVFQKHEVRVLTSAAVQLAGCYTDIEGVQRSISASANKVSSITVDPQTLALDQTFTVAVSGAPGTIGSGSAPDYSVMAFSPASSSSWPTMAVRLEAVTFVLKGFKGNSTFPECRATLGTTDTSANTATWTNTLVIRNFSSCANTNKHTYVATYTFRLIGSASTNPVIRPLSSIASGTQVKYTGTLPTVDVKVPITDAVKPVVTKNAATCSSTTVGGVTTFQVPYKIEVSITTATATTLDKIRDQATTGGTYVANTATFTDVNSPTTPVAITPVETRVNSSTTYWDFIPTNKFKVSSATKIILNYTLSFPLPAAGSSVTYSNLAYAMYGDVVLGSSSTAVSQVSFSLDNSSTTCGYSITYPPKPKEPQAIFFEPPSALGAGVDTVLSAYADSALPVTLEIDPTSANDCIITYFNGVYTFKGITEGALCKVNASQSGDTVFAAATVVQKTIKILRGQVISHAAGILNTNTSTTVELWATSLREVTVFSVDPSICTIDSTPVSAYNATTGKVTYTVRKVQISAGVYATGACILNANQAGDLTTWAPAPSKDITIGVGKEQLIDFSTPTELQAIASNFDENASLAGNQFYAIATAMDKLTKAASQNPVYFSSATPTVCSVVQAVDPATNNALSGYNPSSPYDTKVSVTIIGPGTCTLYANQDGNKDDGSSSLYAAASTVTRNVSITGTGLNPQLLSFPDSYSKIYGDSDFTVTSTSTDTATTPATPTNLLVTMSTTTPTICELASSVLAAPDSTVLVKILSAGNCIIKANQAGNNYYSKALEKSLTISIATRQVSITGLTAIKNYDGNTTVDWGGTAVLTGEAANDGPTDISFTGSPSGSYPNKLVGNPKTIPVSGYSLTGSKASNYSLANLEVQGVINKLDIAIKYSNVTKATGEALPTCAISEVVSTPELASSDTLTSISCAGFPADTSTAGDSTITPSAAIIKDSTGSTDLTANYNIEYLPGTLTVTAKTVPDLQAEETWIVYGDLQATLKADSESTDFSRVKAKKPNTSEVLAGTITHKISGSIVTEELPVGDHTLTVDYTPGDSAKGSYSNKSGTRLIHIITRKLKVTGIAALTKVYDGTDNAEVEGEPKLVYDPVDITKGKTAADGYGYGVKDGDQVQIVAPTAIKFSSKNVGADRGVTYEFSLSGDDKGNYEVAPVSNLKASITPRKLSYRVSAEDKIYDGTNSASVAAVDDVLIADPAENYGAVVEGDTVALSGIPTGTFTQIDVSDVEISISVSNRELINNANNNYELTHPTGVKAKIIPRKLTISGLTGINKVYNGNTAASVSGEESATLTAFDVAVGGIVDGDKGNDTNGNAKVGLDSATATYNFVNKDAGTQTITITNKALAGTRSHNYSLQSPPTLSATIHTRKLRIGGITPADKVYDGTTTVTSYTGSATLEADPGSGSDADKAMGYGLTGSGIVTGEEDGVALDSTRDSVTFETAGAGDAKTVTYSGKSLTGTKSGNYELTGYKAMSAKIYTRKLRIKGLVAENKVYDGTKVASVTGTPVLEADPAVGLKLLGAGYGSSGIVGADVVTIDTSGSYEFADADVKALPLSTTKVFTKGKTLTGTHSSNYELSDETTAYALIEKRKVTVSGISPIEKQYDGTKIADVSGLATLAPLPISKGGNADDGVVSTDVGASKLALDPTTSATYEFASKNVGTSLAVTMTGKSLSGTRAHNYALITPPDIAANIIPRPLTLKVSASRSKMVSQPDPTFTYGVKTGTSFASGEDVDTIGGVTLNRVAGSTAGAYEVTVTPNSISDTTARDNYVIDTESSTLYIADATIATTETDGLVTDPAVDCGCFGFKPNSEVTLTLHSDPIELVTVTVDEDGTCPLLKGLIPEGTAGDHELVITGQFPNGDPITYTSPIRLAGVNPSTEPTVSPPVADQKLSVFVWLDLNGNGIQDAGEPNLPGLGLEVSQGVTPAAVVRSAAVGIANALTGPAVGRLFAMAIGSTQTDASGFLKLDYVALGDWVIKAVLPTKLSATQDSDTNPDGKITAVITSGNSLETWMGVQGHSAVSAPIFDSQNQPATENIEILWEGLDEALITWDDVTFLKDPETGILKLSGMPSGNYRLIKVGKTLSDSECVDIKLDEYKTFSAKIVTQKSAVCFTSAAQIGSLKSGATGSGSGLAATGGKLWLENWLPISLALIAAGSWLLYRSRRRGEKLPKK